MNDSGMPYETNKSGRVGMSSVKVRTFHFAFGEKSELSTASDETNPRKMPEMVSRVKKHQRQQL
jgi:hypothetical protein